MSALFLFGTLRDRAMAQAVLGRAPDAGDWTPATLADHRAVAVPGQWFPMLVQAPGASASGELLRNLTPDDLARLDYFEALAGFTRTTAPGGLRGANGPVAADCYRWDAAAGPHADPDGPDWSLADWQDNHGALMREAARGAMLGFGRRAPDVTARRWPSILTRSWSALQARHSPPTALRRRAVPGDVVLEQRSEPYAHFFSVEDFHLRHRRFDGSMSPVLDRAAFVAADAATVLPYDPVRDRVMLIEQFRMGPLARGDRQCWSLEAIAGRLDAGECPEDTLRREAREEAGLTLGALHKVHGYYASPGAFSEYVYSFVGIADLPDGAGGLGGLPGEDEDIRAHILPFEAIGAHLASGEIENAPLLISLMWLERHRDTLRAKA